MTNSNERNKNLNDNKWQQKLMYEYIINRLSQVKWDL